MPAALPGRDEICAQAISKIASGETVRKTAAELGLSYHTLQDWLTSDQWSNQYARARELCAHVMAEEILEISDDGKNDWMERNDPDNPGYVMNGEHVQRSRLRVDTRKWLLSKILPKQYGDKLDVEHKGGVTIQMPKEAADI